MIFNNKVLLCIGIILFLNINDISALKDIKLKVPHVVISGEDVVMFCNFHLEDDSLYSVRWYKDYDEFYRYVVHEYPPDKVFRASGINVDIKASNSTQVTLKNVNFETSGKITCEVSMDAPSFFTVMISSNLEVVEIPTKETEISNFEPRYELEKMFDATCTSEGSFPNCNLTWYVNEQPVNKTYVENEKPSHLKISRSRVRLRLSQSLFVNDVLNVRCSATLYDIYENSSEIKFELKKDVTGSVYFLYSNQTSEMSAESDERAKNHAVSTKGNLRELVFYNLILLALYCCY